MKLLRRQEIFYQHFLQLLSAKEEAGHGVTAQSRTIKGRKCVKSKNSWSMTLAE